MKFMVLETVYYDFSIHNVLCSYMEQYRNSPNNNIVGFKIEPLARKFQFKINRQLNSCTDDFLSNIIH